MSPLAAPARWFTVPRPLPAARWRLICLPHAGAGASTYFAWGAALQAAGIEVRAVQYPGRESRLAEPCIADAATLVAQLAEHWPLLAGETPCALYGHSMGGLLGFELARELARRGARQQPRHLFLSGRNPPHLPSRLPTLRHLPDGDFLPAVAARYGNLPAELIADAEMAALISPILRADFTLVDTYAPATIDPVDTPLTILGGTQDPWTRPDELAQWQRHTRAGCRVEMIAGDHFFHQKNRPLVLGLVQATLATA